MTDLERARDVLRAIGGYDMYAGFIEAHLKEDAAFQNAYDDEVEHYRQVFHRQEADLLDVQKVAHANEQKYLNAMTELTALRNAVRQAVAEKYWTPRLRQLIEEKE